MSYDKLLRGFAGVLVTIALFTVPVTATAAPTVDAAPWATAWQGLVDTVRAWIGLEPPTGDAAPAAHVRGTSDLGSTLDPDGHKVAPEGPSDGFEIAPPETGLGSTLDPDG